MVIESCISFKMGFLSEKKFKKINDFLFSIITYPLNSIDNEEILKFIKFDKKQLRNKMHFILLKDIGQGIIENNVDSLIIKNAIKEVLD
jgi:3-dehydroquinate synthetase